MEWRNAKFTASGLIDCEIDHPKHGWIPFTVDPADAGSEFDVAALDQEIRADGNVAPYVAPAPVDPRDNAMLDRATFCKALRQAGILPAAEAALAAQGGWPDTFASFVAGLTPDEAADAQIDWACAANIHYAHPLLQQLALAYASGDQAQATAVLDAIFGIS